MRGWALALLWPLAGCAAVQPRGETPSVPVQVQILAINDFHGNLQPPRFAIDAPARGPSAIQVPAGGIAYLAGAAKTLRAGQPHSVTVAAGDLIGAAPLVSSLYLDEPAIAALGFVGLEYSAVGNHEFDKGSAELLRMQDGGCARHTNRVPCALEPFAGAKFRYLAANVLTKGDGTLFPGTAIKDFGDVQIGFIGMTLKDTGTIVSPAGVAGLTFADEAATANALVPALKLAGADAIVVLIHQGGETTGGYDDKTCPNLTGDILPILARLSPAVDVVISGHTHRSYICELLRAGTSPLLLTSAGQYGTLITDIRLTVAPGGGVLAHKADNIIVQGEGFTGAAGAVPVQPSFTVYPKDAQTAALVDRYVAAAAPVVGRVVGKLSAPLTRTPTPAGEHAGGDFIADAQLAAARPFGAQIAFSNSGGVRASIVPSPQDGSVTFGQLFAMQPFGNQLVLKTLTGVQLKALLEQQFASGANTAAAPNILLPSRGFVFAYDLSRPAGQRIVEMTLDGKAIEPAKDYRVAVVNFLSTGGDNFTVLTQGTDLFDPSILDIDASEAWLKAGGDVPQLGRIENRSPTP